MSYEKQQIGPHVLYRGDCLEVLPTLGKVDAVVTDPPYGIGEASGKNKSRSLLALSKDYGHDAWDDNPVSQKLIDSIIKTSENAIIFGGNYYAMPPTSCWLVWDKVNGKTDFADCELAWTNLKKAVRKITFQWHGMIRACGEQRGDHPTQKPIRVMELCIGHLPDNANTILDPFMGSGTTGVACVNLGRKFIGIEKERKYFDIACERIQRATNQGRLFAT